MVPKLVAHSSTRLQALVPKGVVSAPIPGSLATARLVQYPRLYLLAVAMLYYTSSLQYSLVTTVEYFVIFADYSAKLSCTTALVWLKLSVLRLESTS